MSDLLPAVLLNALRQYKFDGFPLWRMADGRDHVKIEVTFRKPTNQRIDHQRQHRLHLHLSYRDQLHRLLLQNHRRQRNQEESRRRRTLHPSCTSMLTLRKNTLYMRSTTSRMSSLQSTRPSRKLKDNHETTKKSTSTCQYISSTIETTNIGL